MSCPAASRPDWPALYARLMTGCGYTPDTIDALPMGDVLALLRLWRTQPPAHEVLAAAYGLKPAPAPDPADPSNLGALIARFPNGTR